MNMDKLQSVDFFQNQDLQYAFDALTKVLNREMITNYMNFLIKEKRPFSVCLCDVDHFKNVNDFYGHMMGDEVLQIFAHQIEKTVGKKGIVGRYGGDEFMIILDSLTEYNDIWEVCHKINVNVGQLKFEKAEELNVTVTTGISRFPIDGSTYEELISTVDRALSRGKMKGRNCFIIYLAAKHSNIMIQNNKEKMYSSMEMINRIFVILSSGTDLKRNIKSVINYFSSYLMIDHICVESPTKICVEQTHQLSNTKEFEFIDNQLIFREMNSSGLFFLNARKTLLQIGSVDLHAKLKEQKIFSLLAVKIECDGTIFGLLRADATNVKIWQSNEMDLFVCAAKIIGIYLKMANTTLDELYKDEEKGV